METLFSRQEALRQRLKLLTEEKSDLQTQLVDCHLKIEQEGKVEISVVPVDRAQLWGLCAESNNICWFSFIILQTSGFRFFQAIKYFCYKCP